PPEAWCRSRCRSPRGRRAARRCRPGPIRARACATRGNCGARPRATRPRERTPRASPSFAHLAAGELEEHVLEVRGPVHESQAREAAQAFDDRCRIAQVAERGLAVELRAHAERLRALLEPALDAVAVDLHHFGLDVLRDEVV